MNPLIRPSDPEALLDSVHKTELTPWFAEWVTRYQNVGGERKPFLWPWILHGIRTITLPCADPALRDHAIDTKMMSALFVTLVDDIADTRRDEQMFEAVFRIVEGRAELEGFDTSRRQYLELVRDAWQEMWKRAAAYPHYETLRRWLQFDYRQVVNGLHYDLLINQQPASINEIEHRNYMPHSMTIIYMAMIDLCVTPALDIPDLGILRAAFSEAQHLGRIGNTLMGWEREVLQGDVGSSVFARALDLGIITSDRLLDLSEDERKHLLATTDYQSHADQEWWTHREKMRAYIEKVRSVDLAGLLDRYAELYKLNLAAGELGI